MAELSIQMSPLQVLQPRQSFVKTLFSLLLVSLWTQPISAWIQRQPIVRDPLSRSIPNHARCRRHCNRHHVAWMVYDEQSTLNVVAKNLNSIPERQGAPAAQPLPSRRRMITNMFLLFCTTAITITISSSANAVDDTSTTDRAADIDPFATMDSIASGFGSLGSPSPTKDSTRQAPTTAAAAAAAAAPIPNSSSNTTGSLSPLEKALEESRKRKQIDPRTHG